MAHEFAVAFGIAAVVVTSELERHAGEGTRDAKVGGVEQSSAVIDADDALGSFYLARWCACAGVG